MGEFFFSFALPRSTLVLPHNTFCVPKQKFTFPRDIVLQKFNVLKYSIWLLKKNVSTQVGEIDGDNAWLDSYNICILATNYSTHCQCGRFNSKAGLSRRLTHVLRKACQFVNKPTATTIINIYCEGLPKVL